MEAGITSFGYDSGRAFDDFLKKTGVLELPGAKDASRNDWTKWLNPGWDAKAGKWNWETDKSQTANTTFRDRERQLADAEENLRKETASARLTAVKDNWTRDLQREATAQQSRLMFGSNDNALTFGADTFYTAAREAARGEGRPHDGLRQTGGAGRHRAALRLRRVAGRTAGQRRPRDGRADAAARARPGFYERLGEAGGRPAGGSGQASRRRRQVQGRAGRGNHRRGSQLQGPRGPGGVAAAPDRVAGSAHGEPEKRAGRRKEHHRANQRDRQAAHPDAQGDA